MAGVDWNRAWQTASRWLKQGTGLLFARPALWLGLASLESLATAWLGSRDVVGIFLSLLVFAFFLCSIYLLAWRVALRPSVPFSELALAWAGAAGRIFLVSLPLAAMILALAAAAYIVGPFSLFLWSAVWPPCLWVFLPALLVDGLSVKSSLRQVMQTPAQRWAATGLAVLSLLALAGLVLVAAFVLLSLLKLLGGAVAAVGGRGGAVAHGGRLLRRRRQRGEQRHADRGAQQRAPVSASIATGGGRKWGRQTNVAHGLSLG